jgi:nucleoside-diphosphate-sugar epimerase
MIKTNKPSVLVTGATGFIGGRLAQRLVESGYLVKLLVRNRDKLAPSLCSACEIVQGDLADFAALVSSVRDVSIIYHCAANVNTWDSWDAYYATNVLGVKNLLNTIETEGPNLSRLVHLSTVDVYGFPADPCDEECDLTGRGFSYGETKLLGESLVTTLGDSLGIPYTILRPTNVIGPGSQFISRIGDELKSGIMLKVDGGRVNAGMLYVENLIDYMIWAAESPRSLGECYNVRDNYDVSWDEFLSRFRVAIEGRGRLVNLPFFAADAIAGVLEFVNHVSRSSREPLLHHLLVRIFGRTSGHSAEKIYQACGHLPMSDFNEAIECSVRWYQDEYLGR